MLYGAGDGDFTKGTNKFDSTDIPVGEILGHVWPDKSRTDPSDGVVEENYYFFFPDPTFHGVIVPIEINTKNLTYVVTGKAMSNAELNALIKNIQDLITQLTSGSF